MNKRTSIIMGALLVVFLTLTVLPGVALAQPSLTAFSFTPTSINVASAPATVTVNFTATDAASGVTYLEMYFVDSSGAYIQRGAKSFAPASPLTNSVSVIFPAFSPASTWSVGAVFLADAAGNTLILDTAALATQGFPTTLTVTSAVDTTPPNITAFSFTPVSIDTTAASANVTVNFTLTDNLSGANFLQVAFTSPSGNTNLVGTKSFAAATSVDSSVVGPITLTFPRFSEAGTWNVSQVFVADAAGNTLILNNDNGGLVAHGFATTLTVTSTTDSTPPTLTTFSFTPTSVNVTSAAAIVTVNFQVADDLSGATTFQAAFVSPSGNVTQMASSSFAASTSFSGTANVTFPQGSENGTWTVATVFLADAAGNTKILATSDLAGQTPPLPTQLTVTNTTPNPQGPTIVATISPSPGPSGWNTTVPVTVSWSVTDPLGSGIASSSGCGTTTLSVETMGMTFTCTATNNAGNTNSASAVVRIDTTPPIITPIVTPAPNAAGWNNTNTTLTWSLSDPISGIDGGSTVGCVDAALTAETAGATFTCSVANGAGLTSSASVTIKIDMTPPTTVATASPAPNGAGWNSTNVTVTFTGTDNLSGIASCTAPITLSTEGTGQTASGICRDNAGNVSTSAVASGIKIDKTAPTVVATVTPAPNASGWNNTNATVTFTGTDALSGIASCTAPVVVSTEGTTSVSGTCTDVAGNVSAPVTVTVKIDKTPPTVVGTVTPAPNAAGWNNTNATVTFTGTDALSGIASCTAPVAVSTEGTTSVSGTCSDVAGNVSAPVTVTVKIDKTPPVTTATPLAGALFPFVPLATVNATATVKTTSGTTLGSITVTCFDTQGLSIKLNSTDSGSGVASITYAATGGQTIASTTVNGASAQPSITANGLTTLTYAAKDVAGNSEATKSESVLVGRADNLIGFACASPTPTFTIPDHGKLVVSGTVTSSGITLPFNQTITF